MTKTLKKLTTLAALAAALLAAPGAARAAGSLEDLLKANQLTYQKADNGVIICYIDVEDGQTVKLLMWETPLGEWKAGSINVLAAQAPAAQVRAITPQLMKLQGAIAIGRLIVDESEGTAVIAYQVPFVVQTASPEEFKVGLIAAVSFGPQVASKAKTLLRGAGGE